MDATVGHIEVVCGPMFAFKTSEVMRRVRRYARQRRSILVISYSKDLRYSTGACVATHDGTTFPAVRVSDLSQVTDEMLKGKRMIAIDEGQFFGDKLIDFAERNAAEGRIVLVAALDTKFDRSPFENVATLMARAERVDKLPAVCRLCTRDAAFTKRLSESTEVEVIGGDDLYAATCRACHAKPLAQFLKEYASVKPLSVSD